MSRPTAVSGDGDHALLLSYWQPTCISDSYTAFGDWPRKSIEEAIRSVNQLQLAGLQLTESWRHGIDHRSSICRQLLTHTYGIQNCLTAYFTSQQNDDEIKDNNTVAIYNSLSCHSLSARYHVTSPIQVKLQAAPSVCTRMPSDDITFSTGSTKTTKNLYTWP